MPNSLKCLSSTLLLTCHSNQFFKLYSASSFERPILCFLPQFLIWTRHGFLNSCRIFVFLLDSIYPCSIKVGTIADTLWTSQNLVEKVLCSSPVHSLPVPPLSQSHNVYHLQTQVSPCLVQIRNCGRKHKIGLSKLEALYNLKNWLEWQVRRSVEDRHFRLLGIHT